MKLSIDTQELELILRKNNVDATLIKKVVEDAEETTEGNKAEKAQGDKKKNKYKYLIVASDPDDKIPNIVDTPMWVFKVPEEEKHTEVLERFYKGVYEFNSKSRKGRKAPIKTIGDGIQNVGPKYFKPNKSPIVTKEPVIVLKTDNKIPS